MNLGTVLYCPPRGRLNSDAFLANLGQFKSRYPIHVISDDGNLKPERLIDNPEKIGRRPAYAISNYIFFKALELARDAGLTYFLYLESDSRVYGDFWDEAVFAEHQQRYPEGIACAGTPIVWDVNSGGNDFAKAVIAKAFAFQETSGIAAGFYGGRHPQDCSASAYYVNGSGGVYRTEAMLMLFAGLFSDIIGNSRRLIAYDLECGRRLWFNYGPRAVDHVGWLTTTFSGYGDCILDYEARKALLLSGRTRVLHQVKDGWVP